MPRFVKPTSHERFNPIERPKGKKKLLEPANMALKHEGPLPVTLLSGFLGAGKTTLLQHILTQEHGLRIAVVVNDIGAVNVDANIIQNFSHTKPDEKVVAMQNGCICCTLRGDLLEELVKLSKLQKFDYIIIESSGISEPEQVAETFDDRLADQISMQSIQGDIGAELVKALEEIKKAGGLEKFAKLDTTVTVIDAFTMLNDFDTQDLLSNRRDDVTPEDERTVSDLMVDQIEFANVIIMNKLDMIDQEKKTQVLHIVKSLNHDAKIIETTRGRVHPKEIVNTGKFDLGQAQRGKGWLQDIHEMIVRQVQGGRSVVAPKPETEEYNVSNFIYQRRRPFHPRRLQELIYDKYILQLDEGEYEDDDEEKLAEEKDNAMKDTEANADSSSVHNESSSGDSDTTSDAKRTSDSQEPGSSPNTTLDDSDSDDDVDSLFAPDNDIILKNRRNHPIFRDLYRSKGLIWLATRPTMRGSWSQAGAMLTIVGDQPFMCTLDEEDYLTGDPEVDEQMKHSLAQGGEWGDREQEVVFIGYKLQKAKLEQLLDDCLLNDEEWEKWQNIMRNEENDMEGKVQELYDTFDDGFPDWVEEDEHDHDHDHAGHSHGPRKISDYAEEIQEVD